MKKEAYLNRFVKDFLSLVVSFGLVTGFVEVIELYLLRQVQWLNWRLSDRAIWYETLWISPLVDLALFSLVGSFLMFLSVFFKRKLVKNIALFVFILLAVFDWLFIVAFGKISLIAILLLAAGLSINLYNYASRHDSLVQAFVNRYSSRLAIVAVTVLLIIQGGGWLVEMAKTASLPPSRSQAPNILVIVIDALRADHLSLYGYERNTSPFIDKFAKQGVVFDAVISTSSWTLPSHASLMTGLYTYDHKADGDRPYLDDRFPTVGEKFQLEGYRTAAFSGNTFNFTRRQGFGRGFLHFEDNFQSIKDISINSLYGFIFDYYGLRKVMDYRDGFGRRYASEINQSVLRWIGRGNKKPFFVFINYFDVHDPYTPPEPYRSRYSVIEKPGGMISSYMDDCCYPALTPELLQGEVDAYDGSINYVDDQIKSLLEELKQQGTLDNTLVVITSDHGEELGEHNLWQHTASLYIQEIHVPLIIWMPDVIPSGVRITKPVSISSIPSTILEIAGVKDFDTFKSPALNQLWLNPSKSIDWPMPISELAQVESTSPRNPSYYGSMSAVISDKFHYIKNEKLGVELYNRLDDPVEIQNLSVKKENDLVVKMFNLYLESIVK